MNILIMGIILFIAISVIFKVLFFVLSVLFAGAGLLIKSILFILLAIPLVPIVLVVLGSALSLGGLLLIAACSLIFFFISESDRRYEAKYK